MSGSHRHGAADPAADPAGASAPVATGAVRVLFAFLAASAIATVVGLVVLWPDQGAVDVLRDRATFSAPGVTFVKAEVTSVRAACPEEAEDETPDEAPAEPDQSDSEPPVGCGTVSVFVSEGPDEGTVQRVGVPPAIVDAGLSEGDTIRLMRVPGTEGSASYSFNDVVRNQPLWLLTGLFVIAVAAVARLRGILALLGLGIGGVVVVQFMLPALLSGSSGLGVAMVGSAAIMFVVLYLAHGPSIRTSAALAGTLAGVGTTAALGHVAVAGATLSGFTDEGAQLLSAFTDDFSFQGLVTCALVVAGLGVLNDVTITQASAVWELRQAAPEMSRAQLFSSAMRIGRDHIASTIYTIVFAYAGGALAVLLLISLYDRPLGQLLSSESISEEIVRTLCSGIGLVLAVPVTTIIAALTVAGPQPDNRAQAEGATTT